MTTFGQPISMTAKLILELADSLYLRLFPSKKPQETDDLQHLVDSHATDYWELAELLQREGD